jgi:hypothetical protein
MPPIMTNGPMLRENTPMVCAAILTKFVAFSDIEAFLSNTTFRRYNRPKQGATYKKMCLKFSTEANINALLK